MIFQTVFPAEAFICLPSPAIPFLHKEIESFPATLSGAWKTFYFFPTALSGARKTFYFFPTALSGAGKTFYFFPASFLFLLLLKHRQILAFKGPFQKQRQLLRRAGKAGDSKARHPSGHLGVIAGLSSVGDSQQADHRGP